MLGFRSLAALAFCLSLTTALTALAAQTSMSKSILYAPLNVPADDPNWIDWTASGELENVNIGLLNFEVSGDLDDRNYVQLDLGCFFGIICFGDITATRKYVNPNNPNDVRQEKLNGFAIGGPIDDYHQGIALTAATNTNGNAWLGWAVAPTAGQ